MTLKTIAAGAALTLVITASASDAIAAQTKASIAIGPKEPIPYSQLDAYLKASPKARASKDWWGGSASASTGASVDTSATTSAPAGTMSGDAKASTSTDTSVNPPASSIPSTSPTLPESLTPDPGKNLPGSTPDLPPTTPK